MKEIKISISWNEGKFYGRLYNEIQHEYFDWEDEDFHQMVYMLEGAINVGIEMYIEMEVEIPGWYITKDYKFIYVFKNMQTLLKAYTSHISLAAISKVSGINPTLLSHYVNGLKEPREKQAKLIVNSIKRIGEELSAVYLP